MPISTIDSKGLTSPLTSGVTTNTVTSAAATALTLQSAGTTAITADTTQNIGIGTTTPARKLHVRQGGVTTLANTNGSLFTDAGNAGVLLGSDNVLGYISGVTAAGTAVVDLVLQPFGGNVLVNTTSGYTGKLRVNNTGADGIGVQLAGSGGGAFIAYIANTNQNYAYWVYNGSATGSISTNGTTTSYNVSSDYRLKEDIQPMIGALATVAKLKPVTYKWKSNGSDGQGFIAHELQAVVPDCVTGEKDAIDENGDIKPQGIDTSFLVATLTAAIQELKAEVDALKARLTP